MTQTSMQQIATLIKAHIPYIWVTTYEEKRFIESFFSEVAEGQRKELWTWSAYQGLSKYEPGVPIKAASGPLAETWQPNIALSTIISHQVAENCQGTVFIMKDFHTVLTQPIPRQMRDIYHTLAGDRKTIIILSPCLGHGPGGSRGGIEPTLDKEIMVVNYELPTREAIESRIRSNIQFLKEQHRGRQISTKLDYNDTEFNKFSIALQGLTELEVDNAIASSICYLKKIDERKLLEEKKQIIQRSDILEYIGKLPPMSEVGGLDVAKKYFKTYSSQFSKEAREYGVEPLRGVILTGVPGAGKSLIAKAIAAEWGLPLLRLDVGKVMAGLVGESESRMRNAVQQVEAVAPCVCWTDEIEKALSGTKSSGFSDGGTLSRVFGTLLTAMEEGMKGVVVIATCNDIQALPPELIRRFNEVMFVDLPVPSEREEIFNIHCLKRGRDPKRLKINMEELVAATHLFTGSEIEKVITEAIARAFQAGKRDIAQEELLGAIQDTKCMAKVMKDNIDAIRTWARGKARYASSLAKEAAGPGKQKVTTKSGKELDLASELDRIDEIETKDEEELAELNNILSN